MGCAARGVSDNCERRTAAAASRNTRFMTRSTTFTTPQPSRWMLLAGRRRGGGRRGRYLGSGRRLANLLKILLHELLIDQRNLVAMNLAARFAMRGLTLRPWRLQRLLAIADLHHDLTAHIGRALPQHFADLAHGLQLLRFLDRLLAILRSRAILRIGRRVLIRRFLAVARFVRIRLIALIAFRIGGRGSFFRLLILALRRFLALIGTVTLLALLGVVARLLLFAVLRLHLAGQIRQSIANFIH